MRGDPPNSRTNLCLESLGPIFDDEILLHSMIGAFNSVAMIPVNSLPKRMR